MRMTEAFKAHLVKTFALPATASDEEALKLVAEKMLSGELAAAKIAELTQEPDPKAAVNALVQASVKEAMAPVSEVLAGLVIAVKNMSAAPAPTPTPAPVAKADDDIEARVNAAIAKAASANEGLSPAAVFGRTAKLSDTQQIRVKAAVESYSPSTKAAVYGMGRNGVSHHLKGEQVTWLGRPLDVPSQRDKAVIGSVFKWMLARSAPADRVPARLRMTEHDWGLVHYAMREMPWTGFIDDGKDTEIDGRKLTDFEVKALLDDATSGGLEAVPIAFDDAVVMTALLYGQLFPYVNVTPVSRGRRMEAFSIGRPTLSGTAEGTAESLFTTTSFISALDTTIFPAIGAMEIGLDFAEDSPVNIGQLVAQEYGEAALAWLDEQIAIGDGTTEPTGITVASGTTSVSSANGLGGPLTVGDFESLMFGVSKAERERPNGFNCFIGSDTTYRRSRSIPVGSDDARRVFGDSYGDYTVMGHPFKVQNSLSANQLVYCNLKRYRMYRRLGASIRYETAGQTLALKNTSIIVLRMRFGGKPELGSAFAYMSDAANVG